MHFIAPDAGWLRFLLLAVVPGYAVAFALRPWAARSAGFHGLALALGAPLLGIVTSIALLAGVPADRAPVAAFVLAVVGGLAGLARRRAAAPAAEEPADRASIVFALAVALVCAAFPFAFEWWRICSDAWTHEGVVRAIMRDGLPPGDPWYAGRTLRYAWVYHVAAGAVTGAKGPDVFAVMAAFSTLAGAATVLAAASIAALWNPLARGWTLALLVLGLNALFPVFLPLQVIRAFSGEVRGLEALRAVFDLQPFGWDRTGAFLRSLGGQDFFLNKFLVATPLALALACFTAWIETLVRALRDPRRLASHSIAGFLLLLAGGLMHPVVGLDLVALVGLLGLGALVRFHGQDRRRLLAVLASSALAILPVAAFVFTYVRTGEGGHAGLPFDLAPLKLLGLLTCLALGLAFGARDLVRDLSGGAEARLRALLVFSALAIAVGIRLPGPSPFYTVDKFSYLVWIPLALAAGAAFGRSMGARRPAARMLIALLLFLPVNGLAFVARLADPGTAVRQPWDRPDFVWMRETLPADAVLLVPPRDVDIAVFAGRDQFYGLDSDSQLRGYAADEIAARKDLIDRLFEGNDLTAADRTRLEALGRPVYAVWTERTAKFWLQTPGAWSVPAAVSEPIGGWSRMGRVVHRGDDVVVIEVVLGGRN